MNALARQARTHTILSLQERASQSKFWSMGVFISLTFATLVSSLLLVNSMRYTEVNLLMVESQPLLVPILTTGILVGLYLALLAAISVSREIDKGTLETLMYGPVDEASFLVGTYLGHVKIFIYSLGVTLVWANLCVWLLNLSFRLEVLGLLLASLGMALELIALALLSSVWGGKTRNALIALVALVLFLGGIQLADVIVSGLVQVSTATVSDPLILVRNLLAALDDIVRWISPFAQSQRAMQALVSGRWAEYGALLGIMLAEALGLLGAAMVLFKRKGIRGIA